MHSKRRANTKVVQMVLPAKEATGSSLSGPKRKPHTKGGCGVLIPKWLRG